MGGGHGESLFFITPTKEGALSVHGVSDVLVELHLPNRAFQHLDDDLKHAGNPSPIWGCYARCDPCTHGAWHSHISCSGYFKLINVYRIIVV